LKCFGKKRLDTAVRYQGSKREIRIPLVAINSKRIDFVKRNKMTDISQVNREEIIREYGDKETDRMINEITMLKLQKQILELQLVEKRKQKEREQRRKNYGEKREEEEERRQKEKEEEEERKRIDEE